MDTALSLSSTTSATEVGGQAAHGFAPLAEWLRVHLFASRRAVRRSLTREELAELHERRLEAERLRDETRRAAHLTHTF